MQKLEMELFQINLDAFLAAKRAALESTMCGVCVCVCVL